jgi:hypothetical protein
MFFFFFKLKMPNFTRRNRFLGIMYGINILVVFFLVLASCRGQEKQQKIASTSNDVTPYRSFGKKIERFNTLGSPVMYEKYLKLSESDTLSTKFNAKVVEVCQAKGCWMRLALNNGEEAMVKFKDYGFFVPLDIAGKEVIVSGMAFVDEMSVAAQKHYAKDGGVPDNEIAKITEPKKTYGFLADGVLLKE